MRIDELQHALDDLAGKAPEVDDALRAVMSRASRKRGRSRVGIGAVCALTVAAATFGAVQLRSSGRHVSVVSPSAPPNDLAHLAWTRIAAPSSDIVRVVTANAQTFAVGSTPGVAVIYKLDAAGAARVAFRGRAGASDPRAIPAINDMAGVPGILVAVGQASVLPSGQVGPAAWRSTDDGRTWEPVAVDPAREPTAFTTILRIVVVNGEFYAFGKSYSTPGAPCPNPVWTSNDGTHFRLTPTNPTGCLGYVDATVGPAGVVATTSNNATAWNNGGGTWLPHPISTKTAARVNAIDANANGYVAVGSTGDPVDSESGAIWWSPNARTWTRVATDSPPANPNYQQASFTGVAHTTTGWVAVGWQLHPGGDPAVRDATLWTSPDGQHWTEDTHDAGTFEQHAIANRIGVTANGFAITGSANITGTGTPGDPIRQDDVLWIGSST
jgi:hypothetical protein